MVATLFRCQCAIRLWNCLHHQCEICGVSRSTKPAIVCSTSPNGFAMKHETSARCRVSRSVKPSNPAARYSGPLDPVNPELHHSPDQLLIYSSTRTAYKFKPKEEDSITLQWRHNERDGVSNHRRLDCLLNRLFRCWSKKTSKLHVTCLCEGGSPVTDEFPAQRASKAEMFPFDDVIMRPMLCRLALPPIGVTWSQTDGLIQQLVNSTLLAALPNA